MSFGGFRKTPRASCLVPRVVAGALKIARQRLFILKLNGCPTAEQRDTFTQVESSRAYCIRQQEISPWLHLPLPPPLLFYFRQLRRFLFGASLFIPDSHLLHNFMAFFGLSCSTGNGCNVVHRPLSLWQGKRQEKTQRKSKVNTTTTMTLWILFLSVRGGNLLSSSRTCRGCESEMTKKTEK